MHEQEVGQHKGDKCMFPRSLERRGWGNVLCGALRSKRVERGSRRMEDVLFKLSWIWNSLPAQLFERVFFEQLAPEAFDRHSTHTKVREGKRRKSQGVQLLFINSSLLACLLACFARSAREEQRLYVCTYS